MEAKTHRVLAANYMTKFNCIGSACEDCCCVGTWQVSVDKATFFKYRNLPPGPFKELLGKNVVRNRRNPSVENYAQVKFGNNHQCPFLSEDHLCRIQQNLGEAFLGKVCRIYPRVNNIVDGRIEKVATVSCPEAARVALLDPEGIRLEETFEAVDTPMNPRYRLLAEELHSGFGKYFYELRALTVEVLQNRKYDLWERLMILGLFFQSVQKSIDMGANAEIPFIIEKYKNMAASGAFQDAFTAIPSVTVVQRKILKKLVDERLSLGNIEVRYFECFNEMLKGLDYVGDASEEQLEKAYQEALADCFPTFMQQYGYVMENYLVNYVFKNLFPLGGEKRVFDNYVVMILHYSLLKMHLLGMLRFHGQNLNMDHIIKLIQSFAKVVEHTPAYVKRILQLVKDDQMNNLSYMAILIKN